ncbi:hypothetical protein Vretifemale_13315, partial [Volvox reticuliferus]
MAGPAAGAVGGLGSISEGSFSGGSPPGSRSGSFTGATFDAYRMKLDADDPWAAPAGVVAAGGDGDVSGNHGGGGDGGGTAAATTGAGNGAPFRRTDVVLHLNRAVVLLRTSLGRPLLELDVRNMALSYQCECSDLSRSYAYFNVSAWTHNLSLGVWEPLLEPWEVLAHLDDNRAARPIAGVSPGTAVRITSTQLDVSLLACGAAGGPPRVVAGGTLPLQSDWLANEVDTLRNTAAAAAAAAAAAGTLSFLGADGDGVVRGTGGAAGGGSDVSETVDVRLFPTRVVHGGDGSSTARGGRPTGHGEGTAAVRGAQEPPPMLLQLRLSLDVHQVDSSWKPFLSRTRRCLPSISGGGFDGHTGAAVVAAAVRGGRRAVRLYGSDVWVPFGQMGGIVTSGPGGDILQASSFIPIRAGPGLVLERSSGPGGQPLELLRSLAVLINRCGAPLEVSLVAGDPEVASWTLLAGAAEPEAKESHQWSGGLLMATLDEGGARLLCCRPNLATPTGATKGSGTTQKVAAAATAATAATPTSAFSAMALMPVAEADAAEDAATAGGAAPPRLDPQQAAWLSVSMECEALVATSGASSGSGGGLDTVVDWRLIVRPPLTLHNTLPVAGRYIVWERQTTDAPMRVRQQGRVAGGAYVPVFSADMRMQVYLSFAPDGCEYGESDPVILSDGYMRNAAGVAAAPRLPDSFRCTYSHSASFTALRINLLREVDTSAASGVFAASGRRVGVAGGLLTPGEAVAHGYPLAVSLHVPIWFVNATRLPVSCGVMAFEVPSEAAAGGGPPAEVGGGGVVWSDTSVTQTGSFSFGTGGAGQPLPHLLRIIDTEAFRNAPRPSSYVSVLPRSLELLSYPPGVPGPLADDDGGGGTGNSIMQAAVVLRLDDSRWTQPIYLPRPGEQLQPRPGAGGVPLPSDRLLVRALCKDGCIHEVAVRLDSAPLGLGGGLAAGISMAATRGAVAVVVRLEHHVVLTNTTGYELLLLQPELTTASGDAGGGRGGLRGQVGGTSTGSFTAGGGGGGGNNQPLTITSRAMSVATGGGGGAGRNVAMAPVLTVSLPPGSVGVPLRWAVSAASRHQLCLALPLGGETATSATAYGLPASTMWSEPLKVDMPGGQDAQVALPVYCLGPVGRYHSAHASGPAAGALAAMAALSNMTPQQQRLYELQRAHAVARQMFAALCGGGNVNVGDPGVGPKSFKLENAGSSSSAGSGSAAEPGGGGGGGANARSGIMFAPGLGPGLLKLVREASGGDVEGGGQQGGDRQVAGGRAAGSSSHGTSPPSLEPNLVRIVRPTELGNVEFLAVLLNVRLVMRAPGCLTLHLTSLGGQPQHLLHNGTPNDLMWRQASPRAAWARLPGYSAAAACRGVLGESWGAPVEVELRDTEPQSESSLLITTDLMAGTAGGGGVRVGSGAGSGAGSLTLGFAGAGGPLGAAAGDLGQPVMQGIFSVGQKHREVMAQACSADDLVLTPAGLCPLPGAGGTGLGASRLETIVRMVVVPTPLGPAAGAGMRSLAAPFMGPYLIPAGLYGSGGGGKGVGSRGDNAHGGGGMSSSTFVVVSIGSLELSLVDGRPEEIAVLTVDDLTAELTTGRAAGVDFSHLSLRLRSAQLDDQIPGSAYPVVLQPLEQYGNDDPLFVLQYCCQPGKLRTALHCPLIAARLLPLRLSLAETLMWRVMAVAKSVGEAGGMSQQPLEQRHRPQQQQVSGADFPLAIDLMVVDNVPLRLSFRAEATFRPRWASGGFMRLGLDLAQLEDLALELPGIELERVRLLRSALLKKVYDRLQERIFSMALAVLRSAGIVGGISKVLAVSSAGVAQLASDSGKGTAGGG